MKAALLTYVWNPETKKDFWIWETSNERTISKFNNKKVALENKPQGYKCIEL